MVWTWSRPYGLCHCPYTEAHIKGFGSPYFHVYAYLFLCFILVLASLILGFAMFGVLRGLDLVWLHLMPMRPCSDVTAWDASLDAGSLRAYHFLACHAYCVGQFCPVFKLRVRKPGPILSPFMQMEQGRAGPNTPCEGKRRSEDNHSRNRQNYHPRRVEACWWGIGPCPRTMVSSGPLSEVSGELVNHSE